MFDYSGDFEAHLTVRVADETQRTAFQAWCRERSLRCVRIVLARGDHVEQPMATWRRRQTTKRDFVAEAEARAIELQRSGTEVIRVKVEAAPSNADVPGTDAEATKHDPANYFEHHVKLLRSAAEADDGLLTLCGLFQAHLSRNAFKQRDDGRVERFVTMRGYGVGLASAQARANTLVAMLRARGETVLDLESEYCVYDSHVGLDAGWLQPPV